MTDFTHGPVHSFVRFVRRAGVDRQGGKLDRDSEIDAHLADCVSKIPEVIVAIGGRIGNYDDMTTTKDHLIESQVFKMSTIRKVNVLVAIVSEAKRFVQNRLD